MSVALRESLQPQAPRLEFVTRPAQPQVRRLALELVLVPECLCPAL
jgi:hypothetical protein